MTDVRELVRELALALPEGCSERADCPDCHRKGTFNMSRSSGEVSYICFSASCQCRGVISSRSNDGGIIEQTVLRQRKLFNGTLGALDEYEVTYLADKFLIEPSWLCATRYGYDDGRVYYPQYNQWGSIQGYIARHYPALDGDRPTKGAKAYWKAVLASELGLCFPNMDVMKQVVDEQRVVLVEDYPSMLRINSQLGIPCCCLGGTNIYPAHVATMLSLDVSELTILLDADAITKAVKLKRSLALAFDTVKVIPLMGKDKDPKDMTLNELLYKFGV